MKKKNIIVITVLVVALIVSVGFNVFSIYSKNNSKKEEASHKLYGTFVYPESGDEEDLQDNVYLLFKGNNRYLFYKQDNRTVDKGTYEKKGNKIILKSTSSKERTAVFDKKTDKVFCSYKENNTVEFKRCSKEIVHFAYTIDEDE